MTSTACHFLSYSSNKWGAKNTKQNVVFISSSQVSQKLSYVVLGLLKWQILKDVSIHLTLCPTAEKHHPHHGGGFTRPQATTIVTGIYARHRVNSLVPAYEALCVWVDGHEVKKCSPYNFRGIAYFYDFFQR